MYLTIVIFGNAVNAANAAKNNSTINVVNIICGLVVQIATNHISNPSILATIRQNIIRDDFSNIMQTRTQKMFIKWMCAHNGGADTAV